MGFYIFKANQLKIKIIKCCNTSFRLLEANRELVSNERTDHNKVSWNNNDLYENHKSANSGSPTVDEVANFKILPIAN